MALKLDGVFIECGVFRGFKSFFLANYLGSELSNRKFYLFDTFEGIDEDQSELSPIKKSEHFKVGLYDFVVDRFSGFSNFEIVKGSVPQTLDALKGRKVAFLHLRIHTWLKFQLDLFVNCRRWGRRSG